MTRDEINARINAAEAELTDLDASGSPDSGSIEDPTIRRRELEAEIAGLKALLNET